MFAPGPGPGSTPWAPAVEIESKTKSKMKSVARSRTKFKTKPSLRTLWPLFPWYLPLLAVIGTQVGTAIPTEAQSTSWLARTRRDENEGIENRHRTASVGFYIGDPCNLTCSRVLYHVFCNVTSRRCECRPEYPVNIRNRQCVKASPLGGTCEHDEACAFTVAHSFCNKRECTCRDGHEKEASKCVPTRGVAILDNAELTTMVTVIVALMLFTALFCLVLRLFSKARFGSSGRDRMADAGASPAVLTTVDGAVANSLGKASVPHATSRRPSRSSVDYGGVNSARRASYGMLAPPGDSAGCSRRASDSSLRSQASQRSGASARSGSVSKSGARSASGVGAHSPGGTTTGSSRGSGAHEAARRTSSSPLEGNGAASTGAGRQKQPITRPLRLHLSQELRSKENAGYDAVPNFK